MTGQRIDTAPAAQPLLETRLGAQLAAALSVCADQLAPDVRERLRIAREHALERAASARTQVVPAGGGLLARLSPWWLRLGLALPAVVLVAGLLLVQALQQREAVDVAAAIDVALLVDDLPPGAYADPGFVAFLGLQQP